MEDKIILIDKPAGISSFGVVAKVRRQLTDQFGHKVKVGHTGTLDPFATGLLILLSGKMTKKSSDFLKLDKVYEATLRLGYTSTTGDPEGEITKYIIDGPENKITKHDNSTTAQSTNQKNKFPSKENVSSTLDSFIGRVIQTPPKFSAIQVGGQRAYKLARKGQDFTIPSREVEIYSIEIISYDYPELKIRTHVSSGTYIRTLAEDIGHKLGTGAYLTALRRTQIGDYSITSAQPLASYSD